MKKKIVAIVMAALMAATFLTACGGNKDASGSGPSSTTTSNSAPSTTTSSESSEDTQDSSDEGDMVSDETFTIIQQNYATMVLYHDSIAEAYNSDEIAANPEIESAMNQAVDIIARMGQIKKDTLTEEKAVELNELIVGLVDGLSEIVESMELAGDADGAEGTPVSDETFEILQANWDTMADFYNQKAMEYSNGEIEQEDNIKNLLNQAEEILAQIQGMSRENMTEEQAVEINNTMILLQEELAEAFGLNG